MRNNSRSLSLVVVVPLAAFVAWFGALPPAGAQEAVSASRYRQTVSVPTVFTTVRVALDGAVVEDLCRDLDGCQVILLNQSSSPFGPIVVEQTRLVLSTIASTWTTTANPGAYSLNGNNVENIVVMNSFDGTCRFSDADADGSDTTAEFSVAAVTTSFPVICTVTLID